MRSIKIISSKVDEQIRLLLSVIPIWDQIQKTPAEDLKIQGLEFDLLLLGGDFIDSSSFDLDG